jgi:hypothetical protein
MRHPSSAISLFIFLGTALLWAAPARASLLIRPPLYLGLNSGLVGDWGHPFSPGHFVSSITYRDGLTALPWQG